VALASFPGSGNTWLRYLLQLSTGKGNNECIVIQLASIVGCGSTFFLNSLQGVFTGSVYKDFALLRNGFPGESVSNGQVLVVKTHESGPPARAQFDKAILLIRKPSEAILAEFNRRAAGHIGHAGRDKYTRNAGRCKQQYASCHVHVTYMHFIFIEKVKKKISLKSILCPFRLVLLCGSERKVVD
jgi:hypothetical protein